MWSLASSLLGGLVVWVLLGIWWSLLTAPKPKKKPKWQPEWPPENYHQMTVLEQMQSLWDYNNKRGCAFGQRPTANYRSEPWP